MNRSALASLTIAGAFFGASPAALAQSSDVAGLLRQGVALRREHRNEEALAVFRSALAIADTPSVRAQVGLAEQALGQWPEAERDLDRALAAAIDPWIAKHESALKDARGIVHAHVATVDPLQAEPASVDGAPAAALVQAAVTPSPPPMTETVVVISAVETPLASRATPPVAGPLVLGALGAIGLGTGAYFGVRAFDYKSDREAQCTGGCKPAALTYDSEARSAATTSTVAFGVGAACVAAGVAWWVFGRASSPSVHGRIDVVPWLGRATGLVVQGTL